MTVTANGMVNVMTSSNQPAPPGDAPAPDAPRGVAMFPMLLGLCCLAVAGAVGAYEFDRLAWRVVSGPMLGGFGGLLTLLALVGLLRARLRSRRAGGAGGPSA